MSDDMGALVKRHYVAIDNPKGVDGAQMWGGKWWAPLWGCDTLGALLNDIPPASDGEAEKLLQEVERLRAIAAAAVRSVSNPAWAGVCDEDVDLERALVDAGLLEGKREIHYGCHCDLDPGMNPDGCVIDEGMLQECTLAIGLVGRGKDKWSCPHWRPAWNRRAT